MTHFSDNHFVKFLNEKTKKIKVIIKGLNNVEVTYGLVKLFTDNVEYLPMAYQFKDSVIKRKLGNNEIIEINNTFSKNNDDNKKYIAFIFSIPSYIYYEFDAQVIQDIKSNINNENNNKSIIILVVIGIIIILALIILVLIFFVKKKENKSKFEMEVNDIDNNPIEKENLFKGFDDNN